MLSLFLNKSIVATNLVSTGIKKHQNKGLLSQLDESSSDFVIVNESSNDFVIGNNTNADVAGNEIVGIQTSGLNNIYGRLIVVENSASHDQVNEKDIVE